MPSTLTVLNTADAGAGSLRAAVASANTGDTIVFAASLKGQTITLTSGELMIDKSLIVQGPEADLLTISGNGKDRIFEVTAGSSTISGLTLTQGNPNTGTGGAILNHADLTVANCVLTSNDGILGLGGAIANFGSLQLLNTNLVGNGSNGGGALYNSGVATVTACGFFSNNGGVDLVGGGAIDNDGQMTISATTISGNHSGDSGGAIANNNLMSLTNCIISTNDATVMGGGLDNAGGIQLNQCTLSGNTSNDGGGINNRPGGVVTALGTTMANNAANQDGGAIENAGTFAFQEGVIRGNSARLDGGGIHNEGSLRIQHSLISNNQAHGAGGGIDNLGKLSVVASSFISNAAVGEGGGLFVAAGSRVAVGTGSVVRGNQAHDGGGVFNQGQLSLHGVTLTQNRATKRGGGLFNALKATTRSHASTIRGNHAALGKDVFNQGKLM